MQNCLFMFEALSDPGVLGEINAKPSLTVAVAIPKLEL